MRTVCLGHSGMAEVTLWVMQPVFYRWGEVLLVMRSLCQHIQLCSVRHLLMYCKYDDVLCVMSRRSTLWTSLRSTRFVVGRDTVLML